MPIVVSNYGPQTRLGGLTQNGGALRWGCMRGASVVLV
jgi:hypothetical protein